MTSVARLPCPYLGRCLQNDLLVQQLHHHFHMALLGGQVQGIQPILEEAEVGKGNQSSSEDGTLGSTLLRAPVQTGLWALGPGWRKSRLVGTGVIALSLSSALTSSTAAMVP